MHRQIYERSDDARRATDAFYLEAGFEYTPEHVQEWLDIYLTRPVPAGRVLDLCCGDGVWARGIRQRSPQSALYGIDLSAGGIDRARRALPHDAERFVVGDAEAALPWPAGFFDLVFARGPGLFNQHCMDRPATVAVIEMWHRALAPRGRMVSIFPSDPARFGTYTNPLEVKLPYNRAPRLTAAVDFTGGKYHHDVTSFLAPFRRAANVRLGAYRFIRNNHILETRLETADPGAGGAP